VTQQTVTVATDMTDTDKVTAVLAAVVLAAAVTVEAVLAAVQKQMHTLSPVCILLCHQILPYTMSVY
jgi:hypothetical protein